MSELKGHILQVSYDIRSKDGPKVFSPIYPSTLRTKIKDRFETEHPRDAIVEALTSLADAGYFTASHRDRLGRVLYVTDLTEKGRSEAESLNQSD